MDRTRTASLMVVTAALGAATALSVAAGAGAQGTVVGCKPANNVEAIIDDSGSMALSDRNELRRTGLELFIGAGSNQKKTLGAVEFGTDAATVFAPRVIGASAVGRKPMITALRLSIDANNGGTNYDAGFIKAFQDNPKADARIFLTDGANNGTFLNTHRAGARTYVVGLGIGAPGPTNPDANRLQQIATETGGIYFPGVDAATFQPTFNAITAAVSCLQAPRAFVSKPFTKAGQTSSGTAPITRSTRNVDVVLNWAQPTNAFAFSAIQALGKRNKVLADLKGRGKRDKLRTKKSSGETFRSITVRKPKGTRKLRFRLKAGRVTVPEVTVTQLTQRR